MVFVGKKKGAGSGFGIGVFVEFCKWL